MPRAKRIHYAGAFYHVMLRGNNYQDIFLCDNDRKCLCDIWQEALIKFKHCVHAFCLMSNHVHFLVQVDEVPLSKIIQNISVRYTYWFNKKSGRIGHLFQGRYKAILIESDEYVLEVCRYIHLNPVRAGMVIRPDEYFWSSHNDYLGEKRFSWISTDWFLQLFSDDPAIARERYKDFMTQTKDCPAKLCFRQK